MRLHVTGENDMRIYKPTYKSSSGLRRQTPKWYVEFRDHLQCVRRVPAYTDKGQSVEMGRKLEKLVACRANDEPPTPELVRWIDAMPGPLREKLAGIGLLEHHHAAGVRPLADHVRDFGAALAAKHNTASYVRLVQSRVLAVVAGCGFRRWSDLTEAKVQAHLASLREPGAADGGAGARPIGAQTHNFYLQAFKQFCRWMVRNRRAVQSPVEHLQGVGVRTDRRHDRRALSVEELRWLLHATADGPERGRCSGPERAVVYRVAAETGLRGGELQSLTRSSFLLDGQDPHVRVSAAHSKRRRDDVVPLKPQTAVWLAGHLTDKLPAAAAFRMPARNLWARVMRRDLEAARQRWLASAPDAATRLAWEATDFLRYRDAAGRYADFHSLRHVTGSLLAAANVSPKVAQSIMRHADVGLTLNTYSHAYPEDQAAAVARLPDLSVPPGQAARGEQRAS